MLVQGTYVPCYNLANMACNRPVLHVFVLVLSLAFVASSALTDSEILLNFKSSLSNPEVLGHWDGNTQPCKENSANWVGVICVNGAVRGLKLENMGIKGKLDVDALKDLRYLTTLSFMNNELEGPLPELNKLGALRSMYLSNNHFSGEIPVDDFDGMGKLMKIHLANNAFVGSLPSSLTTLKMLMELRVEGNQFTGMIPNFTQKFRSFNVSNNELEGSIPAGLSNIDLSSFSGNKELCGQPMKECAASAPAPEMPSMNNTKEAPTSGSNTNPKKANPSSNKLSIVSIVIMAIVAALALCGILAAAFILMRRRNYHPTSTSVESPPLASNPKKRAGFKGARNQNSHSSPEQSGNSRRGQETKLSFVREDRGRFDLQDLLKASAEILGSGCFGSSYKAALTNGQVMVVKRFKQMNNVARDEFQEHMRRLGRLEHGNLLPLVAYYYRKEEKLLVSDFVQNGSLAVQLHGNQTNGQSGLDWPTRLNIMKGVAKGLAYLHKELPSVIAAHGHLKSSNVLLNASYEPLLADYGLVPVMNQEDAHHFMIAYKSPEYVQHGRITKKTDVWSLGMLILEVLTGQVPVNFLPQAKGNSGNNNGEGDLANWVNGIPQDEWPEKVFDKELFGASRGSEGEMLRMLKVGLSCCEADVEKRPDLKEAVERICELREKKNNSEDDFYSSYASEDGGDVRSSRGKSDEFLFA